MSEISPDRAARLRRAAAEILLAAIGAALVLAAVLADQAWFDRHFLPVFFLSRRLYVLGEASARLAVGGLGLVLALVVRPRFGRMVERVAAPTLAAGAARIGLALGLALAATELVLQIAMPRAAQEVPPTVEPLRRHDPLLGWSFVPSRLAHTTVAGRRIDYAFDTRGYRAPDLAHPVDPARPAIVFAGESIMAGYGLTWDETVPAGVAKAFGVQAADMAVFAYADDQNQMRLAAELPRFAEPKAVVVLFSPGLVFRDFDDDRSHLAPGLVWRPAHRRLRLQALLRFFAPYHSTAEIDRTVALVHAELAAEVGMARARNAAALIVIPRFGPEDPRDAALRRKIVDGLPSVTVELDPRQRIPRDAHPNADGARLIAQAVIAGLRAQGLDSNR